MRRGGPFLGRTSARGQTLGSALRMAQTLLRTPLHDRHVALGARLVPFAGWEMPVQYEGVIQEHRAVRSDAGVFDVSHMGEIDVQGPSAIAKLGLPPAPAFTFAEAEVDGVPVMVNRTGYTGEDGCELLCMADDAAALWDAVLARGVVPCGLGARDTLRLEACYPLHGNDISQTTDAISAGLGWTCALGKDFTGSDVIRGVKEAGPERRLVAFVMEERAIPRQGMPIDGGGGVTSGTHSPTLDVGIGMGYVPAENFAVGTELAVDVRGKPRRGRVVKKPFYSKEG